MALRHLADKAIGPGDLGLVDLGEEAVARHAAISSSSFDSDAQPARASRSSWPRAHPVRAATARKQESTAASKSLPDSAAPACGSAKSAGLTRTATSAERRSV